MENGKGSERIAECKYGDITHAINNGDSMKTTKWVSVKKKSETQKVTNNLRQSTLVVVEPRQFSAFLLLNASVINIIKRSHFMYLYT